MPTRTGILNRITTVAGGHPPPAAFHRNTSPSFSDFGFSFTTEGEVLRGHNHALSRGKGSYPPRDKGSDIGQVFHFFTAHPR